MKNRIGQFALFAVALAGLSIGAKMVTKPDLRITYGAAGIQQLSYRDVVLEDLKLNPADLFHIWHMKVTDLQGNILSKGQYGWGEINNARAWDEVNHTWTYQFTWGSISLRFAQSGDTLNMIVTQVNNAGSGVILDGAVIYPLVLHFPSLPAGFSSPSYSQLASNTTGPSVTLADYDRGKVAVVVTDATKPLYSGFQSTGAANAYSPIISATSPDTMAAFLPHHDRSIAPGQTDTFNVSLRFAPSAASTAKLASDAYRNWALAWPPQLDWKDRRIIGTAYLATSPQGNINRQGGYPNNPRRFFNDSNPANFDIRSVDGLTRFQNRVLRQASDNVENLKRLDAQGIITWDIEGQQYPQTTSYVCAPDEIGKAAPEMESTINDTSSPYHGMKLDDAYFKTMRDAGFRVGVCIRPQHFTLGRDGTAGQVYLADSQVLGELMRKMLFAHDRWGATIFYLDSNVEANGGVLDAAILKNLSAALPDCLLLAEQTTPKYYAYTGAFKTFLFHADLGTDAAIHNYYPRAFSAILINDVNAEKLSKYQMRLTESVRRGDILMGHADYWQTNNPAIVQIYQDVHDSKKAR